MKAESETLNPKPGTTVFYSHSMVEGGFELMS